MKFEKLKTGNVSEIEQSIREEWGGVENILKNTIANIRLTIERRNRKFL